ncbi:MAG: hypothetical protein EBT08_21350, partial [Betaproteobacteria bacterium]|nr:hypothetical protein [Betaproteobacteria bacterium]
MGPFLSIVDALPFALAPTAKPYREQGTAAFNLSPIQRQRRAIRDSAKLKSACMQFWTAAGLRE